MRRATLEEGLERGRNRNAALGTRDPSVTRILPVAPSREKLGMSMRLKTARARLDYGWYG
jgi:hypothetical protein